MQWQLVEGRGISSKAIAWFGGGAYSHIDVITPDHKLRGARSDWWGSIPPGYQDRPMGYLDGTLTKRTTFTLAVSPTMEENYWRFSNAQMGKPYDSRGIWGFVFGKRDWRAVDSWFCSEEVAANLEIAGICPNLFEGANRVDPGDCAFILCALDASYVTLTY